MSRIIKFRVWDKTSNIMLDLIAFKDHEGNVIMQSFNQPKTIWRNKPDMVEIMQFTGLLDKNGKEIYEGDVARLHCFAEGRNGEIATIEWGEHGFVRNILDKEVKVIGGQSDGQMKKMWEIHSWAGSHDCFQQGWGYIEIIGNIWENPELIS